MRRWSLRIFVALISVFALVYVADWIVLQIRERSGSAHDSVVVDNSYVIHQKNGKMEYLYDPPQPTPCVRSLLPHQGQSACWWLVRHTEPQKDITAN
jgi:hypothetical protein